MLWFSLDKKNLQAVQPVCLFLHSKHQLSSRPSYITVAAAENTWLAHSNRGTDCSSMGEEPLLPPLPYLWEHEGKGENSVEKAKGVDKQQNGFKNPIANKFEIFVVG